ncbi:YbaB/EbfC family nucleoid-associated protein [Nocardia sp. NEAU-G5]|uniref:YbaB/EbfC family nucleoid-associated protein n=1 Tax=Nocardia albiluteola TaxID=2842303 RepID=A0ABS6B7P3_9NOCA|nr:YbaB/EbfC family nucleoid-associated protein [Nocardia albiluteola]MBU3065380.1 YbaB/EbfC family nucleoid-associated protein [Nocardia albiluteola]
MNDEWARLEASVQAQLTRMQQLSDDLAAIRVRYTAAGGAVTAVVDGSARLLDLQLSEAVSRMQPAEFTRAVLGAVTAAAQQALGARSELIAEYNSQASD